MISKFVLHCSNRWFIPLMLLLALLLVMMPPPVVRADSVVTFPDSNLEEIMRDAINKASGDIYESDLVGLTSLNAFGRGIVDLTGLEYCTSLESLDLGWNEISDLSPLSDLTSLTELWLDINEISDLSPLSGLTALTELWLSDNQISDISHLAGLTSLVWLYLHENQISDLSSLSGLTALTELWLSDNQISDLEPLVDNPGIALGDEVYLYSNPLNSLSVDTWIPALEARGADVYWDTSNQPPAQPINLSPTPPATGVSLTPMLESSDFSDPDAGDIHAASQWQIRTASGEYENAAYDSGHDTDNLTTITVTSGDLNYDTTYYWHVRHQDGRGDWSSWSTETSFTTVPDPTPPTTPVVTDDGDSTTSTTQLHASWTSSDPESGIAEYQYAIGTSPGATNVVGWTSVGIDTQVTRTGLSLSADTTYYFAVKARNGADLWSEVGFCDGITVVTPENHPPAQPTNVSPANGATGVSFTPTLQSSDFSDPDTGDPHAASHWQIRTSSGDYSSPVYESSSASNLTSITIPSGHLTYSTTYYWHVRHQDGRGDWSSWSTETSFTTAAEPTDTTPPTTPVVTDDGATTTSTSQLHATWTSSDTESGIAEYRYAIGTTPEEDDVLEWTSAGTNTEVTRTGLSLNVGTTYYLSVKAKNGAGLWSDIGVSDGILVVDENGGKGEVGGCCGCSNGNASASDLAIVWGMLGLCCGTGLLVARRLGRRDRK